MSQAATNTDHEAENLASRIISDEPPRPASLEPVAFAVDAELLRELGQRLVGRPHIALAELIKNSFDADASEVEISIKGDALVVVDNGHGMTRPEFKDRWMRVGSPHKARDQVSRGLKRPLTGSKGIGRLAVQFLGNSLKLWTRSDRSRPRQLFAEIDWNEAREKDLLTQVTAGLGTVSGRQSIEFAGGSTHGTIIEITRLNQEWTEEDLKGLAQEIWMLQPPFVGADTRSAFNVTLDSEDREGTETFQNQIRAYLDVAEATIKAELATDGDKSVLNGIVRFRDGEEHRIQHSFEDLVAHASIELRVYKIEGRQPRGIKVGDLRQYFDEWGGVHIYDSNFRLPYYGSREQDWLGVERDHAHRLSTGSTLVPKAEQVSNGLHFLPTMSRIFGQVRVSTQDELQQHGQARPQNVLQIQASRDRLVDNRAFTTLTQAVRYCLDFYAFKEAARRDRAVAAEPARMSSALERLNDVVESVAESLAADEAKRLRDGVIAVVEAQSLSEQADDRSVRLLATLASAGASTVAYEHEVGKQFTRLRQISAKLDVEAKANEELSELASDLGLWIDRADRARSLFAPLLDEDQRETERALPALPTVNALIDDLDFLIEGVPVEISVPDDLMLPKARYAEWSAIFQNAFSNALTAMRGSASPRLGVIGGRRGGATFVQILDDGAGIDLTKSESYFAPFERGDTRSVGPGSGMGLAIIRTLANSIGINATFVEPPDGWSTALRLAWGQRRPR